MMLSNESLNFEASRGLVVVTPVRGANVLLDSTNNFSLHTSFCVFFSCGLTTNA